MPLNCGRRWNHQVLSAGCSMIARLPGPGQGLNLAVTVPALKRKAPYIALLKHREIRL